MNRRIHAMPGNQALAEDLARHGGWPWTTVQVRRFPDEESLVTVTPPEKGEEAVLVCTLDRPDPKLLPLLLAAGTLRELGAARVVLVAPYLAYLRQDARFHPGEAVAAGIFGRLLDGLFDAVLTADPHLHRLRTLAEAGLSRGRVVHVAADLAAWIAAHVAHPLILGPDAESAQWVHEVAARIDAPGAVASKVRHGDRAVTVTLPDLSAWRGRTPVLLDDIIASGHTMAEAARALRAAGWPTPICVAVHGVLAEGALDLLRSADVARVVTTDSIAQHTARIRLAGALAAALDA